ncbi:unnamed protein product [Prorocentrum cordatum]|uniref:Uncharacterized protein n=1 Tax=Prorocentrum cordatum TaxID=2364126 RepID=A0ABN9QKS8_9DINO|nr:unnamed protein product [Polarella glacialis]
MRRRHPGSPARPAAPCPAAAAVTGRFGGGASSFITGDIRKTELGCGRAGSEHPWEKKGSRGTEVCFPFQLEEEEEEKEEEGGGGRRRRFGAFGENDSAGGPRGQKTGRPLGSRPGGLAPGPPP